jgi:hypothetical protein
VASSFTLDGPADYTLQEIVQDRGITNETLMYRVTLQELLAAMAGLSLVPKTDYILY